MKIARLLSIFSLLCAIATLANSCSLDLEHKSGQVQIPSYIHEPLQRLDYLVDHYWDEVDVRDSLWTHDSLALRHKYEDYFALLASYSGVRRHALLKPLDHVDGLLLEQVLDYYREYYSSEPTSSVKEMSLVYVLLWASNSPKVRAELQQEARASIRQLLKNQLGYTAEDISFQLDSLSTKLSRRPRMPYRLLVLDSRWGNEGDSLRQHLMTSPLIQTLVRHKTLGITYLYLGSQAPTIEVLRQDSVTPRWIEQGVDLTDSVQRYQVYDVSRQPQLYLLRDSMKVVLKKATYDQLIKYLEVHGKK